jgi:hypothetical protein
MWCRLVDFFPCLTILFGQFFFNSQQNSPWALRVVLTHIFVIEGIPIPQRPQQQRQLQLQRQRQQQRQHRPSTLTPTTANPLSTPITSVWNRTATFTTSLCDITSNLIQTSRVDRRSRRRRRRRIEKEQRRVIRRWRRRKSSLRTTLGEERHLLMRSVWFIQLNFFQISLKID